MLTAWFSLVGVPPGTSAFSLIDKVQHFVAYLATSGLVYLAGIWRPGRGAGPLGRGAMPVAVAVGAIVVAGAIELIQAAIGRDADVLDWVAGSAGVVTVFAVGGWVRRRASGATALPHGD